MIHGNEPDASLEPGQPSTIQSFHDLDLYLERDSWGDLKVRDLNANGTAMFTLSGRGWKEGISDRDARMLLLGAAPSKRYHRDAGKAAALAEIGARRE